jgi:flagellar biosynthesis GTPase FlhF
MKKHKEKEMTWAEIKALTARTSRTLDRMIKLQEKEKKQWDEERAAEKKQRDEERTKEKEEKAAEKKQRDEERTKEKEERALEKKQRDEERALEKKQRDEERALEKKQKKEEREQEEIERKKRKEEHLAFMKRMDRLDAIADKNLEQIGGISKSNGEFCEEYFINCFKENPTLFGEKFDRVIENYKPDPMVINDEYDLILRNGSTIAIIEMKYKAKKDDVGKMFLKLNSYRANHPIFNDYKIYLCLASFRFSKYVREKAAEKGIVLIQQRGEKIEVISENLRTW